MKETITEQMTVAIRTAIRQHPRAKQYAKVNHEDNFAIVMHSCGQSAAMDLALKRLDDQSMIDWVNDYCAKDCAKLRALIYGVAREMYAILRK